MIADAYNKLYIISANHYVFSVDVDTRVAKYIGYINGLPANYSTNGAAVDKDGAIVVSSANAFAGYYKFTLSDFNAKRSKVPTWYTTLPTLPTATCCSEEADAKKNFGSADFKAVVPVITNEAHIYPNPIYQQRNSKYLSTGSRQAVTT